MEREPLVSVVTPFYNTAPYLPECIESVLGQTYGNFEYLLVNNRRPMGHARSPLGTQHETIVSSYSITRNSSNSSRTSMAH